MNKSLKFTELNLSHEILRAVTDLGFEEASAIQAEAIPLGLAGKDIIGQAVTGSGKTAAFGIPLIEKIDNKLRAPQALVLCPTRELAIQVAGEINKISKYKLTIPAIPIYGGQPIERQIRSLSKGVKIVVGTPGRILDHLNRKTLHLNKIKFLVLDEADEMLDMGFREDLEAILKNIPKERQTMLFSVSMPPAIAALAKKYMHNPQTVKTAHEKISAPAIEQFYIETESSRKLDTLTRLFDLYNPTLSIVFCNTKRRVDEVVNDLRSRGYLVDGIHGDLTQSRRDKVMERFRKGAIDILVATDVAARGIDVSNVEAVFNYEIPRDEESYVHRIGRTGRAGKSGKAFSLIAGNEMYCFRDIKRYTKAVITRLPVPTIKDIQGAKIGKILGVLRQVISSKQHTHYIQAIESMLQEDFTTLDIAAALLKLYLEKKSKKE